MYSISELNDGEFAEVISIGECGELRRRLMDLGLIPGTVVECVGKSPLSDPIAFMVRGAVIALRYDDCKNIFAKKIG